MTEHKKGSPEWALARVARGYRRGLVSSICDCHSAAGAWIRQNEAKLVKDPGARLMLLSTQRGYVSHTAVRHADGLWHGPDTMILATHLGSRIERAVLVSEFLRTVGDQEAAACVKDSTAKNSG